MVAEIMKFKYSNFLIYISNCDVFTEPGKGGTMQGDVILDCKGLSCPMPILKLAMAFKKLEVGKVIEMYGTDPGSKDDVPAWCTKTGHTLLEIVEAEDGFTFFIRCEK